MVKDAGEVLSSAPSLLRMSAVDELKLVEARTLRCSAWNTDQKVQEAHAASRQTGTREPTPAFNRTRWSDRRWRRNGAEAGMFGRHPVGAYRKRALTAGPCIGLAKAGRNKHRVALTAGCSIPISPTRASRQSKCALYFRVRVRELFRVGRVPMHIFSIGGVSWMASFIS